MTFIVVMLWIFVGLRVISLIVDGSMGPRKPSVIENEAGNVAGRSIARVVSIIILSFAALGLAGVFG